MTPMSFLALWVGLVACNIVWRHWGPLMIAIQHDWWQFKHSLGLCDLNELYWAQDSLKWRGTVLKGRFCHWCYDWDGLPIDETCIEWPCNCYNHGTLDNLGQTAEDL